MIFFFFHFLVNVLYELALCVWWYKWMENMQLINRRNDHWLQNETLKLIYVIRFQAVCTSNLLIQSKIKRNHFKDNINNVIWKRKKKIVRQKCSSLQNRMDAKTYPSTWIIHFINSLRYTMLAPNYLYLNGLIFDAIESEMNWINYIQPSMYMTWLNLDPVFLHLTLMKISVIHFRRKFIWQIQRQIYLIINSNSLSFKPKVHRWIIDESNWIRFSM